MNRAFDHERALAVAGGDKDLLKELIFLFIGQSPGLLSAIADAVQTGDAFELEHTAHTIKGALVNLGAKSATETASSLEAMGANSDIEHALTTLHQLVMEVEAFENAASEYAEISAE